MILSPEEYAEMQKINLELEELSNHIFVFTPDRRPQDEKDCELMFARQEAVVALDKRKREIALSALKRTPYWKSFQDLKAERKK